MFKVGDIIELDEEALIRAHTLGTYQDWIKEYSKTGTLTVSHVVGGDHLGASYMLGFVETESNYACYHGPYFRLAGPPRTIRQISNLVVRELAGA